MKRKDKEITDRAKIDEIINGSLVCRLAMSYRDNPYLVPVSFGYDGNSIFLHTAREGKKISYFQNNDKVCFEFERGVKISRDPYNACSWSFMYQSVIGFGRIKELLDSVEKEYALNRVMLKYSGKEWRFKRAEVEKVRAWEIVIDSLSGKESHG
ncbi:MAG: pyridoxamine 5'-phosphate oxidase family protein [Spirochaetales bacterium]|nr:pyridoxamine 5'-phosphate oxidase family protein [Spirochaetales bacterium]